MKFSKFFKGVLLLFSKRYSKLEPIDDNKKSKIGDIIIDLI